MDLPDKITAEDITEEIERCPGEMFNICRGYITIGNQRRVTVLPCVEGEEEMEKDKRFEAYVRTANKTLEKLKKESSNK